MIITQEIFDNNKEAILEEFKALGFDCLVEKDSKNTYAPKAFLAAALSLQNKGLLK